MALTITGPSAAVIPAPPAQSNTVAITGASMDPNPPHNLLISYTLNPSGLQKTCSIQLSAGTLNALEGLIVSAVAANEGWAVGGTSVTGS